MFANQTAIITDRLFDLYQEVIKAAREGNYCHGNGAIWCIVEETWDGQFRNVVINTAEVNRFDGKLGYKQYVDTANPVLPHKAEATARNLERFLDSHDGEVHNFTYTDKEYAFTRIQQELMREAIKAGKEGRCIHFNGGQLYFKREGTELVRVVDFSIRGIVQVSDLGKLETRNYLQSGYNTSSARRANEWWAEKARSHYSSQGMLVNA